MLTLPWSDMAKNRSGGFGLVRPFLGAILGHATRPRLLAWCLMPIQTDDHFLTACRYVEANAKRANLVKRAEQWRWASLWTRRRSGSELKRGAQRWPVSRPRNWLAEVNGSMDEESLAAVRRSVTRGVPLGAESWRARIAHRLDLTLRPRGRPRKETEKSS